MGLPRVFPMIVVDERIIAQHGQRIDGHSMGRLASLGVCSIRVLNRFKLLVLRRCRRKNRIPPGRPDGMPVERRRHVVGVMGLESRRMLRSALTVEPSEPLTQVYYITEFSELQGVFGTFSTDT
jgi:hypothetical protein